MTMNSARHRAFISFPPIFHVVMPCGMSYNVHHPAGASPCWCMSRTPAPILCLLLCPLTCPSLSTFKASPHLSITIFCVVMSCPTRQTPTMWLWMSRLAHEFTSMISTPAGTPSRHTFRRISTSDSSWPCKD